MKKRHYSNEFKLEAVRLSYKRENIKELANELGVQVQRIYKWRATHREIVSKKQEDSSEVKQLRKSLKEIQLELKILKKAVHIFLFISFLFFNNVFTNAKAFPRAFRLANRNKHLN